MREQSDQLLTVSTVFLSICIWQSDPTWSPPESPGAMGMGGRWLGVIRGRRCGASPPRLGNLGFRCHGGENRKIRQVDQSEKPLVNSEIDRM